MKKHSILSVSLAAMAAAFMGCSQFSEPMPAQEYRLTVTATVDNEDGHSRSMLQDGGKTIYWEPKDEIKVFSGLASAKLVSTNEEPSSTAVFTGVMAGGTEPSTDSRLYALYPYREEASCLNGVVTTTLPDIQYAEEGTFDRRANIAMAMSDCTDMAFRNVCGGLRFTLTQSGIRSIVFESTGGEAIAGQFSAQFVDDLPTVTDVTNGTSKVILEKEDGSTFDAGEWYYMSFLPCTLSSGYTVTFYKGSQKATLSVAKSQTIKRNTYGTLSNIDSGLTWVNEGEDENVDPELKDNVTSAFVEIDKEQTTVQLCDTVEGKYQMTFSDAVPKIQAGSVIILPSDSANYSVVLATKAETVGNTVSVEGQLGDLSYVFMDTEFTLATGEEMTRSSTGTVYFPQQPKGTRADWNYQLWKTSSTTTSDLFNQNNTRLWTEAKYDASLNARLIFTFGAPEVTLIDGLKFLRAGSYNVDFRVYGNINASYDLNFKATDKGRIDLAPQYDEKKALLKHGLFPNREYLFPVGPVTIPVTVGCDLFGEVSLTYDAELDFNTGVEASASGTLGVAYNGLTNSDLLPYREMSATYERHDPTLKGTGTIEGKVHIFPRIHAWVCGLVGPSVDIKPYAKVVAGGSFQTVVGNSSEDYLASSLKTFVGLDVAVGLSSATMNYETSNLSTPDFNLAERQLYESPVDIQFRKAQKNTNGTTDVSFDVFDRGFDGKTVLSPLWPIVKFEAEGELDARYKMAQSGTATVRWKPKQKPSKLYAKIYDLKGAVIAQAEYECEEETHSCPDGHHPHAIDLGLPSGTKWACCNVGASTPEGYGGYYAWGETSEKSVYREASYKYYNGVDEDGDGYIERNNFSVVDIGSNIAGTSYDVAHVRMGGSWRMPSMEQTKELVNYCSRTWTQQNGVNGILVTGPNGGQIFLPAAGCRWYDSLYGAGSHGDYWSSSLYPGHDRMGAYYLLFDSGDWHYWADSGREFGQSVRAVCP